MPPPEPGSNLLPIVLPVVQNLTDLLLARLGTNLLNITIHGSLALGGFRTGTSDLDVLVVVANPLSVGTRAAVGQSLIDLPIHPLASGLELSVVTVDALKDFRHPLPFELHVSPVWHDQIRSGREDFSIARTDSDLAAHLTVALQRGVTVYGAPMADYLASVPWDDYIDAIVKDSIGAAQDILNDPVYGVLNLCRVLAAVTDGVVLSKRDGGLWGISHLPDDASLIGTAVDAYAGVLQDPEWDGHALCAFATRTLGRIRMGLRTSPDRR